MSLVAYGDRYDLQRFLWLLRNYILAITCGGQTNENSSSNGG